MFYIRKMIVVGAGIAGIATAIRLAGRGHSVIVVESSETYGGKLNELKGLGFRFDTGPSLFTMPWLVEDLLSINQPATAAEPFKFIRLDPICRYFYPDGSVFTASADENKLANDLALQFGENENKVRKYLRNIQKVYQITAPVFLEKSLHRASSWLSKSTLWGVLNLWRVDMLRTMHRANAAVFKNPKTIQLFDRYATYNGSNPYSAPATLKVIPSLEIHEGAYLPEKGMRSIVDSLYQKAIELGVEFHFNTSVAQINTNKNQITGITLSNGARLDASIVISNVDVKTTYSKLLQVPIPEKIKKAENSSSAWVFYWGINTSLPQLDVHNIFFSSDYQAEFSHLFHHTDFYHDPTVYVHISSRICPEDAPKGCDNLFVMVNAPFHCGQNWEELSKQIRQLILKRLNETLGIDLAKHIVFEERLTPEDIEMRTGSVNGSLYGASSNSLMSAFNRQANFSGEFKGLYFCGGSVHPGGGIPLCLQSAKIVSELISQDHGK